MLVIVVIVLIVTALAIYGVDQAPQLALTAGLIKLVIILIAVLFILSRAGLL